MLARGALAVAALMLAFGLGVRTAPHTAVVVEPVRGLRLADLRLEPAAIRAVASLGPSGSVEPVAQAPARAPSPSAAATPVPAPPAPPAADAVLRASVSAVTTEGGRPAAVLRDTPGRRLRAGDSFLGWRVASLSSSGAVLARGRERREVTFFGPAMIPAASPPPSAAPAPAPASRSPSAEEYFRGFKG